jgi:hypothetical protein
VGKMKKIIILFLCILLLSGCKYINGVDDNLITNYLTNSYGKENKFEYSHEGICNLYEMGYCSSYYKSSDLKYDIYVVWYDGDGLSMKDDYLFKKYQDQIADYYKKLFNPAIDGQYQVEILSQKSDMNWDKNATFEDILKYDKLNLSIGVNIISNDKDTKGLGEELKSLIEKKKLKNVSSLYVTTYNKGCNLNNIETCKKVNSSYTEVKITDKFH